MQVVAACGTWCFGLQVFSWCGAVGYVSGLRDAANRTHNLQRTISFEIKNHLLHLVGLLFPRINDDARSNSHQVYMIPVVVPTVSV
jgi:hypothetical protein